MSDRLRVVSNPVISTNPIAVQLLGICSALAVTKTLATALVMSAALTVVLIASSALISLLRRFIPRNTRIVIQITIIASLVIVVDQLLAAFAPAMSRQLSIFVGLIITNCIVLGRAEAFAMHNTVGESVLDGLGNGLGYSLMLTIVGAVRELMGAGALLGINVVPLVSDGGWFEPLRIFHQPPSAFLLIAALVWLTQRRRSAGGATSGRGEGA